MTKFKDGILDPALLNDFERACFERREFPSRQFAAFDPATGVIEQAMVCQIPPDVPGKAIAVFDNVDFSNAVARYRVDLASVRAVEGDHPHCELVPIT